MQSVLVAQKRAGLDFGMGRRCIIKKIFSAIVRLLKYFYTIQCYSKKWNVKFYYPVSSLYGFCCFLSALLRQQYSLLVVHSCCRVLFNFAHRLTLPVSQVRTVTLTLLSDGVDRQTVITWFHASKKLIGIGRLYKIMQWNQSKLQSVK